MNHSCEEVSYLVSESLERKLKIFERVRLQFHFMMCAACRHYNANMNKLHKVLEMRVQLNTKDLKLPHDKREKIQDALDEIDS